MSRPARHFVPTRRCACGHCRFRPANVTCPKLYGLTAEQISERKGVRQLYAREYGGERGS